MDPRSTSLKEHKKKVSRSIIPLSSKGYAIYTAIVKNVLPLTYFESKVQAGFPSPADDYIKGTIDLNELLVKHPSATFLVRATGLSMIEAGIHDNDILIVDRSLTPKSGKIVVAAVDGQLTVKRIMTDGEGRLFLHAENKDFTPLELNEGSDVFIWGVVTRVIHEL